MIANARALPPLLVAVCFSAPCFAAAGEFNKRLSVGDRAPGWSNLPGIDGKKRSLTDYRTAKAVVIVFTCNHCPVAQAYEERLIRLAGDYERRGVTIVAVNCSTLEADRLPAMKARASQQAFNFPYLFDESQQIGRNYGAKVTPEVFVLSADGKINYQGAIDDAWQDVAAVRKHYLRDALEALLANRAPQPAETKPTGCAIPYD